MTTLINSAVAAVSDESKVLTSSISSSVPASDKIIDVMETSELGANALHKTYHEMGMPAGTPTANRSGSHVVELDVLEQLKLNMAQLEDMHARLKFLMAEVRYLVIRE